MLPIREMVTGEVNDGKLPAVDILDRSSLLARRFFVVQGDDFKRSGADAASAVETLVVCPSVFHLASLIASLRSGVRDGRLGLFKAGRASAKKQLSLMTPA